MRRKSLRYWIIGVMIVIAILVAAGIFWPEKEGPIGGEKDGHGCLVAAGYSFDENIRACIRTWELDESQRQAAKVAVEEAGEGYTIIKIETLRCPGCFNVHLQDENYEIKIIKLVDLKILPAQRHYCGEEFRRIENCTDKKVCGYEYGAEKGKEFNDSCQACTDESIEYWMEGAC
jgi:hypothetical protein